MGKNSNIISDDCKKGTIILIKAGKTSYKYHGRAVIVGNYSEVKLNPEIEESSALKLWYQKKDFKNLKNVAYNKCLLLDDGTVAIDEILDHAYDNNIPLIRNIASSIMSIKEENTLVDLHSKNRYICKKCKKHVSPKTVAKIDVQIGDESRSFKAACYGDMAERLLQEYKNGEERFILRIYGILKHTGVGKSEFLIINSLVAD